MAADLWRLYEVMLKSRVYEEGVIAGVVCHLRDGDAMALDHRGTSALLMRGIDPVALLRELVGRPDGLCGGMGGHMHHFSKEHLAASSGIVGAAGPLAVGFALATAHAGSDCISVAFFGDGAMNQGMLMESLNLARVWNLPVLFVCKDDGWAITTRSRDMTGGEVADRVRGFGVPVAVVDGRDVSAVFEVSASAIARARTGGGPTFLHATCVHLEGHFLGFQLLRMSRHPGQEMPGIAAPLTRSMLRSGGAGVRERLAGVGEVLRTVLTTMRDPREHRGNDPVWRIRKVLQTESDKLKDLEERVERETRHVFESALEEVSV